MGKHYPLDALLTDATWDSGQASGHLRLIYDVLVTKPVVCADGVANLQRAP